jgi:predicted permease
MNDNEKIYSAIFIVIFSFGAWFFQAFVFMKLWHWFVVPLGVMMIGYTQALGLIMIVVILKRMDYSLRAENSKMGERIFNYYVLYAITLGAGYIVKGFV